MDKKKIRVRCANCRMIYDIAIPNYTGLDPNDIRGKCPKCGSNAFDQLDTDLTRWK